MRLMDMYAEVLEALGATGADPGATDAGQAFFDAELERFGPDERPQAMAHIRRMADVWYLRLGEGPIWLQSPEWPHGAKGKPMVFVGELSVPERAPILGGSMFYVFFDPDSRADPTVIQQAT